MASMSVMMMVFMYLFLFDLVRFLTASVNDLDVVVEYSCNDGYHVSLYYPCAHIFRPAHTNIDHALKR